MSSVVFKSSLDKQIPLDELLALSWQARSLSRPKVFEAVYPAGTLPVSVTGAKCSLQCAHCGGEYLKHMTTLESLERALLKEKISSILFSGGCNAKGQVPLISSIDRVRKKLMDAGRSFKINAHPGIVGEEEALAISDFATAVSFDFVLDDATIRAAFGGHWTGRDYINTLRYLRKGKAKVVPHILIGLYKGEIRGEYEAVEFLAREGVDEFVFIIFIPTRGTRWEHLLPPDVDEVLRFMAWARIRNPRAKIALGCMRPKGRYSEKLDPLAVKAGVDAMVLPHALALDEAKCEGLTVSRKEECCAFD